MSLTTQNNFGPPVPAGPPQPPRQGAIARSFALMKALMGGGFVLALIIGAAEILFGPTLKPSVLLGTLWSRGGKWGRERADGSVGMCRPSESASARMMTLP